MAGEDHAACQGTRHREKSTDDQERLQDKKRRALPLENITDPPPIPYMVQDKKDEHPDPQPFMDSLADKLIRHQDEQRCRHTEIRRYF